MPLAFSRIFARFSFSMLLRFSKWIIIPKTSILFIPCLNFFDNLSLFGGGEGDCHQFYISGIFITHFQSCVVFKFIKNVNNLLYRVNFTFGKNICVICILFKHFSLCRLAYLPLEFYNYELSDEPKLLQYI